MFLFRMAMMDAELASSSESDSEQDGGVAAGVRFPVYRLDRLLV